MDNISTYPRKGTETSCCQAYHLAFADFNLSPQGDGNLPSTLMTATCSDFNLSPQGDGNHLRR